MPQQNSLQDIPLIDRVSQEQNVELMVFDLDTLHGDPGPIEPNRHTFYEVIFLSQASGIHMIDFQSYEMQDEMIFILAPGQVHSWKSPALKGKVIRFTEVCFAKPCTLIALSSLSADNSPSLIPDKAIFFEIFRSVERIQSELSSEFSFRNESANAALLLMLTELERAYIDVHGKQQLPQSELMERLVTFHHGEEWRIQTVENAASALKVSEDNLNREIKRVSGMSAGAYLRSKTLLEAKRMLVFLEQPISVIAEKLGFVDTAYFSRFFKRESGLSPSEFREKYH